MDADRWQQISHWFERLAEAEPVERSRLQARLEKEDPQLAKEVDQLLAEEEALHPVLQTDAPSGWLKNPQDENLVGQDLGPYRLQELLGQGGMGAVFLAERTDGEFDRQVALKLIRPGRLEAEALNRFRQERQILANLQHPHIARLYDGGTSKQGRVYFTMEYFPAQSILDYARSRTLSVTERVRLFLPVLSAMAYAHAQLVLHLDLKPANVLVNEEGVPKVLDFGIAELVGQTSEWQAEGQGSGTHRYTLAYASPEQIRGKSVSIQSDVYSLGVLLYELLTGQLPVPPKGQDPGTYRKQVLQADLPDFSLENPEAGPIPRDLQAICHAALAKAPEDRYRSVDQLRVDLEAFLAGKPVSVRSQSQVYLLGKFFQRNRTWVAAISVVLLGLIGLVSFYTWQLREERNQARAEAEKARQLQVFLEDIFAQADPYQAQGDTLTVYDLLEQGASRLATQFADQPILRAELALTIARIYSNLNEYALADSFSREGLALQLALADADSSGLAEAYSTQADIDFGLGEYQASKTGYERALTLSQKRGITPLTCDLLLQLSYLAVEGYRLEEADSLLRLALAYHFEVSKDDQAEEAELYNSLGYRFRRGGQLDSARKYYHQALAIKQELFEPPNSEIAYTLNHLASLAIQSNQPAEALQLAKEGYQQRRAVYGEVHVETIASQGNIARSFAELKQPDSSRVYLFRMLQALREIFGSTHPYILGITGQIGRSYQQEGRFAEAESTYRSGLALAEETRQADGSYSAPRPLSILNHGVGMALQSQSRHQAAMPYLRAALRHGTELYPPFSVDLAAIQTSVGIGMYELGQRDSAQRMFQAVQRVIDSLPEQTQLLKKMLMEYQ